VKFRRSARRFCPKAVRPARVLRRERFPTVLGLVGFNAKGDVMGVAGFAWYVWRGGKYVLINQPQTE
jgi:hypothetical protein